MNSTNDETLENYEYERNWIYWPVVVGVPLLSIFITKKYLETEDEKGNVVFLVIFFIFLFVIIFIKERRNREQGLNNHEAEDSFTEDGREDDINFNQNVKFKEESQAKIEKDSEAEFKEEVDETVDNVLLIDPKVESLSKPFGITWVDEKFEDEVEKTKTIHIVSDKLQKSGSLGQYRDITENQGDLETVNTTFPVHKTKKKFMENESPNENRKERLKSEIKSQTVLSSLGHEEKAKKVQREKENLEMRTEVRNALSKVVPTNYQKLQDESLGGMNKDLLKQEKSFEKEKQNVPSYNKIAVVSKEDTKNELRAAVMDMVKSFIIQVGHEVFELLRMNKYQPQ